MNNNTKQKELLLVLHSDFFSKDWVKRNHAEDDGWFSQKEQLKEACRSGHTPEILPECVEHNYGKNSNICTINDANTFIELVFCKHTQKNEKQYSLNPYIFMQVQGFN